MYTLLFVLSSLLVAGVSAAPSGAPTCAYQCPPVDAYAYSVGVHYTTNGAIFCSYPDTIGADPMAYYCLYDELTGVLIDDEDEGSCISNAPQVCARKKRFNIVDIIRRKPKAAPAPAASVPEIVKKKRAANVA
ncbi:hypothetical protein AURDEDRAFT_62670 [Auricularia subglabra TFB-10046 SS5]|nr:hypothetical protein AURDEDRAFT_62670 [Auricularia subglabra TFB-10046 SS5]